MNRLLTTLLLLFMIVFVHGQNISRHEADSLIKLLDKIKPDTSRINLLLKLAEFQIFKPGEYKADLDSAATYINEAKLLNNSIKSEECYGYITLTDSYLTKERGNRTQGKALAEKAVNLLITGQNKFYLGRAYFELADYYDYNDPEQLPKKINLVEQAVSEFQLSTNIYWKAYSLEFLGDLYDQRFDYTKALAVLKLSLVAYESIKYKKLQGVYTLIGKIYRQQGNYKEALNNELTALHTAEAMADSSMQLCEINNTIGSIYFEMDNKELSIEFFKKAMEISKKHHDNSTTLLLSMNVVLIYNIINKPQEALHFLTNVPKKFLETDNPESKYSIPLAYLSIYFALKQYGQAKRYCDQLVKIVNGGFNKDQELNNIYRVLAKYYVTVKQYSAARFYLNKNKEVTRRMGQAMGKAYDLLVWFKLDSAEGNYKAALTDILEYKKISDSMFNATKSKQIKQLEVEYETGKKEDSLQLKNKDILVLSQQNQLQRSNLKQANLVKNYTLGGIILLFIIVALLYSQYRHKQKNSQVITHKNELLEHLLTEKEWLLKEVHHRVKNNLHTVICLLESQAAYLENDALKAIETSQHRIYAMSLIHQKLYQSEEVKAIDMSVYLPEFLRYLNDSFGISGRVDFQIKIEPVELGISQAIPVALVINEAVTNSIKYAFPDKRSGIIEINMHQVDKQIQLTISDNGIGIDTSIANATSNTTLGMELMKGLSEDINAHIKFENYHGTIITMSFKVDPLDNRTNILNAGKEKELSF